MSWPPRLVPLGEAGWQIQLDPTHAHPDRIIQLTRRLADAHLPGVLETVPAYTTLTVRFDPDVADREMVRDQLSAVLERPPTRAPAPDQPPISIPVRYDGPDLEEVATRTGLTTADVVRRHTAVAYRVYLLGFVPGFAYLGDLDPVLALPRRDSPRTRVPAGSVAIAARQTGIYPFATPGGWHLIGRTDVLLFDPTRPTPTLLAPGDRVRFVAMT